MAPFATASDLNEACKRADVSHEERNRFLTSMLDEHSAPGSREQLKKLWSEWVKEKYPSTAEESATPGKVTGGAETPEPSDGEEGS